MKKNSLHFLVSFTSKHIELEQGNSVMVKKKWNYLQAEKHTLIL